jgi:hypothetical protein
MKKTWINWSMLRRSVDLILTLLSLSGLAAGNGSPAERNVGVSNHRKAGSSAASVPVVLATKEAAVENKRKVVINQTRISDSLVERLERTYQIKIRDGRYWYDKISGAWGAEGGPCAGLGVPGLEIGGPLRRDASAGRTGVVVNGRELHTDDVRALRNQFGIPVLPGRFSWDAYGNVGYEGGPFLFNVRQLMAAQAPGQTGSWSYHSNYGPTASGATVGGDGQGFFFYQDGKTSYSSGY